MPRQTSDASTTTRAADETLEDYTLRFAPRGYRRWSPPVVATTALGGIAYLADFSIGAGIGLTHGTSNALLGIAVAALIIFTTGLPIAYYCARYNIDLDLVTRGSGFGYYGSVLTSVIFGSFTFIFFATEGAIMAQGLRVGLGIPLWLGYLITTLIVIPLVVYGMSALSKLQVWTTPVWLLLMVAPMAYLVLSDPGSLGEWLAFAGRDGSGGVSVAAVLLGAGVALSLMAQIGEQVDYLRFMPPKTRENSRRWWISVVAAGPGWVVFGALKQATGAFLAFFVLGLAGSAATEPVEQFLGVYGLFLPGWLAVALAVVLVVVSQIKINVTNAYSGSLTWTNSATRLTRRYPGRNVFVFGNLAVALVLMEANMFAFLNSVLSFYANTAIAWVVTVASDIVLNKYLLRLSPRVPEYRRGMLHPINPVGVISFSAASVISIAMYFGALGSALQPYSPIAAVLLALVLPPMVAIATRGRFYLRRTDDGIPEPRFDSTGTPVATAYRCHVCGQDFERPDVLACPTHEDVVCSLCVTTDRSGTHLLPAQSTPLPRAGFRHGNGHDDRDGEPLLKN
ncbi:Purine-cytosine permease [Actinopolyspora lacussalsi subsp. righensis]|uniref:Purine-cytosine permease n=1 Tax=Actinopolyspora righensis TaxID=995060 RepID=A0A1I6XJ39_9ACTN|nr:allantoin permease [Actinopolyspora righensis]SFT38359.1 Purine-cytosine permease [Actinopolyspora righensis]